MNDVPSQYVENYRDACTAIKEQTKKKLEKALRKIDWSDITQAANQAVFIMNSYCKAATKLSASVSAQFYDGLRERQLGEKLGAEAYSGWEPEATEQATRAFVQKIVEGANSGK